MVLVRSLVLSITAATRLLIGSPHPDDGALDRRVARVARTGSMRIVQMTSGNIARP